MILFSTPVSSFTSSIWCLRFFLTDHTVLLYPTIILLQCLIPESNCKQDLKRFGKVSTLPMLCFREGSPPLPDVYNTSYTGLGTEIILLTDWAWKIMWPWLHHSSMSSQANNISFFSVVLDYISNSSFGGSEDLQIVEKCYPMQKTISLMLTNEQVYC